MENNVLEAVPVNNEGLPVPASHDQVDLSSLLPKDADIAMQFSNSDLAKRFSDMRVWKVKSKPNVAGQAFNAAGAFVINSTVKLSADLST